MDRIILCRHCGGTNCEHGDACRDCGCPRCGFPGAMHPREDGRVPGFCADCGWEATPGAHRSWQALQPRLTDHQVRQRLGVFLRNCGVDVEAEPDDEVGAPIIDAPGRRVEEESNG